MGQHKFTRFIYAIYANANSPTNAGSVAMYLSSKFSSHVTNQFKLNVKDCECIWVNLKLPDLSLLIGVIYRHSKTNMKCFLEKFEDVLKKINRCNKKCIFLCNYDINILSSTSSSLDYSNTLIRNAFMSVVKLSTRQTDTSKTLIDHVFTNISTFNITLGVLQCDLSDHYSTWLAVSKINASPTATFSTDYRRNMKNFN